MMNAIVNKTNIMNIVQLIELFHDLVEQEKYELADAITYVIAERHLHCPFTHGFVPHLVNEKSKIIHRFLKENMAADEYKIFAENNPIERMDECKALEYWRERNYYKNLCKMSKETEYSLVANALIRAKSN